MQFFRCYNPKCADKEAMPGHDFMAEEPVCDKCGIDGKIPKFSSLITKVVCMHFDPPSEVPNIGLRTLACDPTKMVGTYRATGEPLGVNCPMCRKSVAWIAASKERNVHPDDDIPLDLDLEGQVTKRG